MRRSETTHAMRSTGVALLTAVCALAACQLPDDLVTRDIRIQPYFKPSCSTVCGSTCLACVDALKVFAITADGRAYENCHNIAGRWNTLCDVNFGDTLTLLTKVPANKAITVELRAYRNSSAHMGTDAGLSCEPPTTSEPFSCNRTSDDLMLWGRSLPTHLGADSGTRTIEVQLECRAGCDCLDIVENSTQCPEKLKESACLASRTCAKQCSDASECFGGSIPCDVDTNKCDPTADFGAALKPFCARCSSSADCEENLCVARSGVSTGNCARSCPDKACPLAAMCTPIDTTSIYRILE